MNSTLMTPKLCAAAVTLTMSQQREHNLTHIYVARAVQESMLEVQQRILMFSSAGIYMRVINIICGSDESS